MPNNSLKVIYSAYITLRNGKRVYAHEYGLKAFRFLVPG